MNEYYTNNQLQMNVIKTTVMIITEDKEELEKSIVVNNNKIENSVKIKILGTVLNNKLNWNDHLNSGQGSLLNQLKQRLNSLKSIARTISQKFAKQLANSILISKLNYNLEVWGNTSQENKNKINRILIEAARVVLGKKCIGRTKSWIMKEMKWLTFEKTYENTMQNSIYKIINSKDDHFFKQYLTNNRGIRNFSQNKVGHHSSDMGHSPYTQKSYLYLAINLYNKLPRNITLIKQPNLFKKWVKRYNFDNKTKLKEQVDNTLINEAQIVNLDNLNYCQL